MSAGDHEQTIERQLGEIYARLYRQDEDRVLLRQIATSFSELNAKLAVIVADAAERRQDIADINEQCKKKVTQLSALEKASANVHAYLGLLTTALGAAALAFWQFLLPHLDWKQGP